MDCLTGSIKIKQSQPEYVTSRQLATYLADSIARERKQTVIFKRYITPQKNVIEGMLNSSFLWLTSENRQQLTEDLDRIIRYTEELAELRDRSQILTDEIRNKHAIKLNEFSYIFSLVATVFLPLSFLTGLMGINIGGMPGVNSSKAFWIFFGMCSLIVFIQIAIFRRFKWL